MTAFFRAFLAAIAAAFRIVWRLVRTPFGWVMRPVAATVTPATSVALAEEGTRAVEAHDDRELDNALRYYLGWRLGAEHPSRGGKPPETPPPSLDSVPAAIAHWARALTHEEVRHCFLHLGPPEHLVRHVRRDEGRIFGLPTVEAARKRPIPHHLQSSAEKLVDGERKGAGGGPNAVTLPSRDIEADVEALFDELRMSLQPAAGRPR